jgi:hypothetical protein
MARDKSTDIQATERTFRFIDPEATLELRIVDARAWLDSPESRDSHWHTTPDDVPGRLIAVRLTLG